MNDHFKYWLFFAAAASFLPVICANGEPVSEYRMPNAIWENDQGKPDEFSIARGDYMYVKSFENENADFLWDYLGTGASYKANILESTQPIPYGSDHTYMLASVLGLDNSVESTESKSPGMFSWSAMNNWPRKKKVIALNVAAVSTIMIMGATSWDDGSASFHFNDEGWYDPDTKFGGADKLGHAYSGYVLTSVYNSIYKKWGYSDDQALFGGVLSSWSQMTLIELGDGFSQEHGFSWEDEVMNTVGVGIAYLREKFPSLKNKIDFRMEWLPSPAFRHGDRTAFTDYSGQKYLIALKPDGFLKTDNSLLKALELHFGYYSRGYDENNRYFSSENRYTYFGVGLNVTYILEQLTGHRAGGIFDYVQVPYTYISSSSKVN